MSSLFALTINGLSYEVDTRSIPLEHLSHFILRPVMQINIFRRNPS